MCLMAGPGAEVEKQNLLGTTALHQAVLRRQIDLVSLLIEHGADVNRVGRRFMGERMTPLQAAGKGENNAIFKLLRQHGAK